MTATHNNNNNQPHHHTDDPLELRITTLIATGRKLACELFNAHMQRAAYKCKQRRPAWMIREELATLEEQLELDLAELERRQI